SPVTSDARVESACTPTSAASSATNSESRSAASGRRVARRAVVAPAVAEVRDATLDAARGVETDAEAVADLVRRRIAPGPELLAARDQALALRDARVKIDRRAFAVAVGVAVTELAAAALLRARVASRLARARVADRRVGRRERREVGVDGAAW